MVNPFLSSFIGTFWGQWLPQLKPRGVTRGVFNPVEYHKILWVVPFEVTRLPIFDKMNKAFLDQAFKWQVPIQLDLVTPPLPRDWTQGLNYDVFLVMEPLVVADPRSVSVVHCARFEKDQTLKKQVWITLLDLLKRLQKKSHGV